MSHKMGDKLLPMAIPSSCKYNLLSNVKKLLLMHTLVRSRSSLIWAVVKLVYKRRNYFKDKRASLIGILVNMDLTSKEIIILSVKSKVLIFSTKTVEFKTV